MDSVARDALGDMTRQLEQVLGNQLISVILFGSQARGSASSFSDIDVAVIVRDRTPEIWDQVSHISADLSVQYDVIISPLTISEARWLEMTSSRAALAENIRSEGVLLWKTR